MALEVLTGLEADISALSDSTQEHFDFAQDIATDAITTANELVTALMNLQPQLTTPSTTFTPLPVNAALQLGAPPTPPVIPVPKDYAAIPEPILPDLSIDWPYPPDSDFSDLVVMDNINIPDIVIPDLPIAPEIDFAIEFPVEPEFTYPITPSMLPIGSVSAPSVSLPSFTDIVPQYSGSSPGSQFSFSEQEYTSDELDLLIAVLKSRLQGGTGLNPLVEQAIWDRGKDREASAGLLAERNLLVDLVSMGFSRPPGSIMAALDNIAQQTQAKLIDLSREVMIKQAEMEQQNLRETVQSTLALEDTLIKQNLSIAQRAFDAATKVQEFAIDLYKAEVQVYSARVEGYKASAQAFAEKIRGELARVEVFKAQISAETAKASTNESLAKMYEAQIQGVKTKADIYQVLVNATSDKIRAESVRLEAYKSEISAYSEQIKAQGAVQDAYAKQVSAQTAKMSINEAKAKIVATRFDGYSKLVDGKVAQSQAKIAQAETTIKSFQANVDALAKHAEVQKDIYLAGVSEYGARSENYRTEAEVAKAAASIDLATIKERIEQQKYVTEIQLKNTEAQMQQLQSAFDGVVEAQKAAGTIASSLASSALSSINVNSSLQGSLSLSGSDSNSTER